VLTSLVLRYGVTNPPSLNSCDRSQRHHCSVAETMIFTFHMRRFAAATCRGDVSQRFAAWCVSALRVRSSLFQALGHCEKASGRQAGSTANGIRERKRRGRTSPFSPPDPTRRPPAFVILRTDRLDFRRSFAGSFPGQRLVIEPTAPTENLEQARCAFG